MPIYEVSLCIIEEADDPESAVDQVMAHYDIYRRLEVEDVTEEYTDSFKPLEEQ